MLLVQIAVEPEILYRPYETGTCERPDPRCHERNLAPSLIRARVRGGLFDPKDQKERSIRLAQQSLLDVLAIAIDVDHYRPGVTYSLTVRGQFKKRPQV